MNWWALGCVFLYLMGIQSASVLYEDIWGQKLYKGKSLPSYLKRIWLVFWPIILLFGWLIAGYVMWKVKRGTHY